MKKNFLENRTKSELREMYMLLNTKVDVSQTSKIKLVEMLLPITYTTLSYLYNQIK